jgi:CRP-like cAMP-binding protein
VVDLISHGNGKIREIGNFVSNLSVIAAGEIDVLRLNRDAFRDVLEQNPRISVAILNTLARRLNNTHQQIIRLATLSVLGRVARSLMDMATQVHSGELHIKGRVKQSALADKVGASRLMVGKALKDLEAKGFIKKAPDGSISIRDKRSSARN